MSDTGDLILHENRLVLPSIYQDLEVRLAHTGHLVLTKTKALLRTKVFFLIMDKTVTLFANRNVVDIAAYTLKGTEYH